MKQLALIAVFFLLASALVCADDQAETQLREDTDDVDRMSWGEDLPHNDAGAVRKYRQAAERGSASAQFKLALMYDSGRGVPQDYAEAVKWLRKAAAKGFVEAQSSSAPGSLANKYSAANCATSLNVTGFSAVVSYA